MTHLQNFLKLRKYEMQEGFKIRQITVLATQVMVALFTSTTTMPGQPLISSPS